MLPHPTISTTSPRLVWLDRLRILAMVDIVAVHVIERHVLWGIGLPVFLITSIAMVVRKNEPPALKPAAVKRGRAILAPWLFWSGVYAAWIVWRQLRHDLPIVDAFDWHMLFYGTSTHLWFLPFILAANLAVLAVHRATLLHPARVTIALASALAAVAALASAWLRVRTSGEVPFYQWLFSATSIPIGFAVGRALSLGRGRRATLMLLGVGAAGLLVIGCLAWPDVEMERHLLRRYGLGTMLVCVAALWAGVEDRWTAALLRCTFDVYLVHSLVLYAANEWHLHPSWPLADVAIVYGISLGVVVLLRQTRLARLV